MENTFIIKNLEDLRKQARHLENEIDVKLIAFNKLGSNIKGSNIKSNLDSVPLLDEEHVFENMATEIESLLTKLVLINEKLTEIHPNGAAMLHTIQRHKDILKDCKLEFNKIRNNRITKKTREDLLDGALKEKTYAGLNGLNRRDMYMKENQFVQNSDKLINDQISIAMDTRDHLISQRYTFKRIQTRFNDISNGFPVINSLFQRINLRKRRDSLIIVFFISFCTVLAMFYIFHYN